MFAACTCEALTMQPSGSTPSFHSHFQRMLSSCRGLPQAGLLKKWGAQNQNQAPCCWQAPPVRETSCETVGTLEVGYQHHCACSYHDRDVMIADPGKGTHGFKQPKMRRIRRHTASLLSTRTAIWSRSTEPQPVMTSQQACKWMTNDSQ